LSQEDNVVNCMIWNALSSAVPADYTPPCYGLVAVVVIPCNMDGSTTAQVTIATVPVPILCDCVVSDSNALAVLSGVQVCCIKA